MESLSKPVRDSLLVRAWGIDGERYPKDGRPGPDPATDGRLREAYFQVLGEYADRLPRVAMSRCPMSGDVLKRSFDPWGTDGPWWQEGREFEIEEPSPPDTFKVLLGAVSLQGRTPEESRAPVFPGPEVPFVVPRLLELPGMVAVVSRLELETGDVAYPIAYFSEDEIPPEDLHQFWLTQDFWFTQEDGSSGWLIANDEWDFELIPWVESGKLRWIPPGEEEAGVVDVTSGRSCPYLDLPGDRFPQMLSWGERELMELPDGAMVNPYED